MSFFDYLFQHFAEFKTNILIVVIACVVKQLFLSNKKNDDTKKVKETEVWFPTIMTGELGVQFRLGRVHKVCQPGDIIWNFPPFISVRVVRSRTSVCELRKQNILMTDNTTWEVEAGLSYKITEPALAMTRAADYLALMKNAAALTLINTIGQQQHMSDRSILEKSLHTKLAPILLQWGVTLENFWITSMAPSDVCLEITQLRATIAERVAVYQKYQKIGELCGN